MITEYRHEREALAVYVMRNTERNSTFTKRQK